LINWQFNISAPKLLFIFYDEELATPMNWTGNMAQRVLNEQAINEVINTYEGDYYRAWTKHVIRMTNYSNELTHLMNAVQLVKLKFFIIIQYVRGMGKYCIVRSPNS
jgi:hypothetical protein